MGFVTAIQVKLNDLHHNLQRGKVSYEAAVASNDAAKIKELERINAKHERANVSERYRKRNQALSRRFTSAGFNAQSSVYVSAAPAADSANFKFCPLAFNSRSSPIEIFSSKRRRSTSIDLLSA